MALDTITIKFLTKELQDSLIDSRIEKVHQPEKDEIVLHIKSFNNSYKLVISANASQPRMHFTDLQKENPMKPPMFCMLLRKHIQSGKITAIEQIAYERIVKFDINSYNELGDLTTKHLYCEFMGRHSNIILTYDDDTVIDSVKHVDFSISSVRQVLPGLKYVTPPAQDKIPVLSKLFSTDSFDFSKEGTRADKALMNTITGLAPILAREIIYLSCNHDIPDSSAVTENQKEKIISAVEKIKDNKLSPCIIYENKSGKTIDFSPYEIKQYENNVNKKYYKTINEMLDDFYKDRDSIERMKQKSSDLVHLLNTNIERVSKKIALLNKTLDDAKKRDEYKIKGDLLTANIYKINQGDKEVTVDNYYTPELLKLKIQLSPNLTPSQNAQKYYKKYQKAKNAEVEATKQLIQANDDLEYLDSTLVLTRNAQSEQDINAIKAEMSELGYIKKRTKAKKQKNQNTSKPHHYISSDGFDIYVGKNNTQNDYLSLRFANSQDIWFHTKKIHGSHTIIKLGINKNVPDRTIKEAASLAAYYSKARESSNVPVDYTQIKNVRKPNGAKPGMVIYDFYNTIYVTPCIPETENKE